MLGHHIRHAVRPLASRLGFATTAVIILTEIKILGRRSRPAAADAVVDWRVAAFAACAACLAALLFSLAPFVQLQRAALGHPRLATTAVTTVAGVRVQYLLVAVVAFAAAVIPSSRATRVDPLAALRQGN